MDLLIIPFLGKKILALVFKPNCISGTLFYTPPFSCFFSLSQARWVGVIQDKILLTFFLQRKASEQEVINAMLPTQTLSHKMSFFILIIFFANSKRQVILLHIFLPLLEFLTSISGRAFICCARAGLNIQLQTNLLASWRKKQIICCQKSRANNY